MFNFFKYFLILHVKIKLLYELDASNKCNDTIVNMALRIKPAIRLHCWGGYGSQLFALLQYWNLKEMFPKRPIVLVFHSAGITKREPEISDLIEKIPFTFKDDYSRSTLKYKKLTRKERLCKKFNTFLIKIIRILLYCLGLVTSANNNIETQNIRPWVISVRGHYTEMIFSQVHLVRLRNLLGKFSNEFDRITRLEDTLVVQYRLGDLLTLKDKSFINPHSIMRQISDLAASQHVANIVVLTDSPDQARILLSPLSKVSSVKTLNPTATIIQGLNAKVFIGSNSKLSFWISLLRSLQGANSVLPDSFRSIVDGYSAAEHKLPISFYN